MNRHLLLALLTLLPLYARAQDQASTYFDTPALTPFLGYAVQSGRMQLPFVLNQPWTTLEVLQAALGSARKGMPPWQQHWLRLLIKEIALYHRVEKNETDGLGYLGAQGWYRGFSDDADQWTEARGELEGKFTTPWFVLAQKTVLDQHFKFDPAFSGDTGEWIYGRAETGYLLAQYKGAAFFLGRLSRNWGPPGEKGLILSDNPYSYDTAGFQLGSRRFRFSFYTSRLNDMHGIDTQSADSTWKEYTRFWSIKRFDLALRPNLQIGLAEAAVYGAVNGTWQMIYLNPFNLYYVEQRNNRVQMNGLWCADLFWKPAPRFTLYGQYLIDDIIVNNEPGQNDRARHPDRMGVTARVVVSDLPAAGAQLGFTYTRIGNWTYMSYRNYENYLSNGLSMGYPANRIEQAGIDLSWFGWKAWAVQLRAGYARQGSQDLTAPFGDTRESFPLGVVSYWTRGELSVSYVPAIWWDARLFAAIDHRDAPAAVDHFRIGAVLHVKYSVAGRF
ncbi:MAG TPA: hypothetical protein PKZ83_18035 [bacterium]|nr:hypothetical protein [bacterium]HQJ65964.1 hypothetical protein [bacterium]